MENTVSVDMTIPQSEFDSAYEGSPPWVIDEPQPTIVRLEQDGQITGRVLDVGCGTGEHTLYLTQRGYHVLGVDFAAGAIARAKEKAAALGVEAQFEVADALRLDGPPRFDTIIDSAVFHVFGPEDRLRYAASLRSVCRPGGRAHVLVLSDAGPGLGPHISDKPIRDSFTDGWRLLELRESHYRVIVPADTDPALGLKVNEPADLPAWLATAERVD